MGLKRRSRSGEKGKKNVEGFYKVLFKSQVKRHTVLHVLLQSGGWVGGKIGYRINIIFSHKMKTPWLELFIHGFQGGTVRDTVQKRE